MYATPDEAEEAFYRAFERADAAAMDAVWMADETVVCVHPMNTPRIGSGAVSQSWAELFAPGPSYRFRLEWTSKTQSAQLAIHVLTEHIAVADESEPRHRIVATNVYQLTEDGWRMFLHHASPASRTRIAAPAGSALH